MVLAVVITIANFLTLHNVTFDIIDDEKEEEEEVHDQDVGISLECKKIAAACWSSIKNHTLNMDRIVIFNHSMVTDASLIQPPVLVLMYIQMIFSRSRSCFEGYRST